MLTYAGLLKLRYKAPELYTVCNMAGCQKETKLTTTQGDKVKANLAAPRGPARAKAEAV